jgi:hypothetical protein
MVTNNAANNTVAENDFSVNRSLAATPVVATISHSDNTAVASNAGLQLTVGGTTSTGDPYVNFLVTGGGTYSLGIDNTAANDPLKITTGATPSAGTELITVTTAGATSVIAGDFSVTRTNGGGVVGSFTQNLSNDAATIARATISTGSGAGSMAFTQYEIGGINSYSVGILADDQSLRFAPVNTGVGVGDTFIMTQAGVATFSSTVNATTFDTNVTAAGVTLAGTTLAADGTNANIDITMTPKGTGTVNPSALSVNSAYTFPTADGNADDVLTTAGDGTVSWTANSSTGVVVQRVNASTTAQVTCTTQLPVDDTIPQKTEGDEVLTVTITPTNSSNILVIEFTSFGTHTANTFCAGALFQDATTPALAAVVLGSDQVESYWNAKLTHYMAAGTTSSTTFKIRCGNYTTPASVWVNGDNGSRKFGGVAATTLCVTEYAV